MASSTTQAADKRSSLILSKGEVRELSLPHLQKFTLGSSEVLSGKYLAEKGKLMIKGLKVGYSELVVWEKAGGATHIPVYVLPKIEHLKLIHLQEFFQKIHLSLESHGPLMVVKGQVKTLEHYHLLKKIAKKYSETHTLHLQVHLNRSLRNTLLGEIYLVLFSGYAQHVRCHFQFLEIFCHYQEESGPKELALKSLQETYDVHFIQEENPKTRINYKIRMKLVQMEKTGGEDLHWGLNQLSAPLEDLFTIGLQGILLKNEFLLKKENVVLSTLAEPEVVIQLGRPVLLEMGQQIPVSSFIASPTTSTSLTHRHETHWKFAGLKVKLLLKQKNGQLNLHYETEFTRPSQEQNIVGNRESSSLAVELNHPYQLFQIGHKSEGQETSSLPWPGPLSFLGQIFASRSQHSSYKRIYGLMTLEEFSP